MDREEWVMVCTSDIAGQVRGKACPVRDLEERRDHGVGWTPTNIMITAHGAIAPSPWGALGDLFLRPDMSTRVRVPFGTDQACESFVLADACHLDGRPWECCLRSFLRRGLDRLEQAFGLRLCAAFEHEFLFDGVEERPNSSYALDAFRRQGTLAEALIPALRDAGIQPDTFMPEYGPQQYEITVAPALGVAAADRAVILREIVRGVAHRLSARASFTPVLRPDAVGNGVHVHFSLEKEGREPVSHDPDAPHGISGPAGSFLAGVRAKLPALTALTAASTISYLRLVPNRWSAAYNNLGVQDREAGLRICPVFETSDVDTAHQFHFEYRAADAAASPYLLLGAIVWAGVWGLEQGLACPDPTTGDPSAMSADELDRRSIARLPQSLTDALDTLEDDADVTGWLGPELSSAYLAHKRFEAELMADLSPEEQCARYLMAY